MAPINESKLRSMKRDFELIRRLLEYFRDKEGPEFVLEPDVGDEYTASQVQYHLRLMHQAGLLNCEAESTASGRIFRVIPFDLSWEGHEFLAKISSEGVWPKLKQMIASKGGSVAFAVINQVATKLALGAAGLP
jgi:hypothetical protein